ncbi:hypothetical protein [Labrys sp. ZIDIC5]|uniref:hypothetical protein n=1 Tax=Labrys sedimenti TaxID=3106036 RepID=UPI002ACA2C6C|nr:hypothetical protein [Labrys sp. ZIDIC5]MDZ5453257.1 hypothetical protein [Labrys sp. ZIDIC5]
MQQPDDPGIARHDITPDARPEADRDGGSRLLALALCALSGGFLAASVSLITAWLR